MFLGLDVGTSAVKAVIVNWTGALIAEADAPLDVQRRRPGWSEQDPDAWWRATEQSVFRLPRGLRGGVECIGLSGQMHGATLLDAGDRPLRAAILWNDGRAGPQCAELERREPATRKITGNAAMPGFTAPKLLWVAEHEPEVFAQVHRILLPKDFVRLRMTGDAASDMSDASGTLWLDVGARDWSSAMLAACGLRSTTMPSLYEGSQLTGRLRAEVANAWGMKQAPVAAGAGDNAAGAVGAGVIGRGEAMLSLGTSGVIFAAGDRFAPAPERGAHAFCHALPGRWHQMAVVLAAASAVEWASRLGGFTDVSAATAAAAAEAPFEDSEVFLPYLSGERTPHNDPDARGAFVNLSFDSDGARLMRAVMEGVAFALADGLEVLEQAGASIAALSVIGGGERSAYWGDILAAALGRPLLYSRGGRLGAAFGAARLARLALAGEDPILVCTSPSLATTVTPNPAFVEAASRKRERFRALYPALKAW